jgi:hypothetical protein
MISSKLSRHIAHLMFNNRHIVTYCRHRKFISHYLHTCFGVFYFVEDGVFRVIVIYLLDIGLDWYCFFHSWIGIFFSVLHLSSIIYFLEDTI